MLIWYSLAHKTKSILNVKKSEFKVKKIMGMRHRHSEIERAIGTKQCTPILKIQHTREEEREERKRRRTRRLILYMFMQQYIEPHTRLP